jgi:hypothetical protein
MDHKASSKQKGRQFVASPTSGTEVVKQHGLDAVKRRLSLTKVLAAACRRAACT